MVELKTCGVYIVHMVSGRVLDLADEVVACIAYNTRTAPAEKYLVSSAIFVVCDEKKFSFFEVRMLSAER